MSDKAIVLLASIKGVLIALLLNVYLSTTFVQSLVTAIVSALISGGFLLISTHMIQKKTEAKVDDKVDTATEKILQGQQSQADTVKDALEAKEGNGNG